MAVQRRYRRRIFGRNPAQYDRVRPEYPPGVYRILAQRCGLGPGTATFEIGPGTGKATRELLRRGARPITLVEPDRRLVRFLRGTLSTAPGQVRFLAEPFESARLPSEGFDLGVAASSFHWLEERRALRKVARVLRPGGWWATWGSRTGDPYRPSAFGRAVDPLFEALPGSHRPRLPERVRFRRWRDRRLAALRDVGGFDRIRFDAVRWDRVLDTSTIVGLHRSFSDIATLPRAVREPFLAQLERLVEDEFGGRVRLHMLAPVFTARRR
jgi:SAM-dependent methyltransferase